MRVHPALRANSCQYQSGRSVSTLNLVFSLLDRLSFVRQVWAFHVVNLSHSGPHGILLLSTWSWKSSTNGIFTLDIDANFSIGRGTSKNIRNLTRSIPLYRIPQIDFFGTVDTGSFSFPPFKVGFYFEIPLIVSWDITFGKEDRKSGICFVYYDSYRNSLFLRGPFTNIYIGADSKTLGPSSRNFKFQPSLSASQPFEVSITVFVGIRPQFIAYTPIL